MVADVDIVTCKRVVVVDLITLLSLSRFNKRTLTYCKVPRVRLTERLDVVVRAYQLSSTVDIILAIINA